jgi:hypothetical protein
MFMIMLFIALSAVPADVTKFTVDLPETGAEPMLITRRADGWWQASRRGKVQKDVFKIEGTSYVAKEGGEEKRQDLSTLLGVDDETNLAELEEVKHPLGVIQIERQKNGLDFLLKAMKEGKGTGKTLQVGKVRWEAPVRKSKAIGTERGENPPDERSQTRTLHGDRVV